MLLIRSLVAGFVGGIAGVIGVMLILAQYTDYRAMADSHEADLATETLRSEIAQRMLAGAPIEAGPLKLSEWPNLSARIEVLNNGVVLVRMVDSEGQLLVYIPELDGTRVTWRCIGGSDEDVTLKCRSEL